MLNSVRNLSLVACVAVLFASGLPSSCPAEEKPLVIKVFSAFDLQVTEVLSWTHMILGVIPGGHKIWREVVVRRVELQGTAWGTWLDGAPVLVTVAHNMGFGVEFRGGKVIKGQDGPLQELRKELGDGSYTEQSVMVRTNVVFGDYGVPPREIGMVPRPNPGEIEARGEVAVIKPADPLVFEELHLVDLANRMPSPLDKVTVVALPGTTYPDSQSAEVTFISPDESFFVINKGVQPGASGGVVLNENHKALGVVASVDVATKQTTVWSVNKGLLKRLVWSPAPE